MLSTTNSNWIENSEPISNLDTTTHNTQYHNQYHLIGIIDSFVILDLIDTTTTIITVGVIVLFGTETKCGWIGYGDIHMETEWDGLTVGETTHGVVIIGTHLTDGTTTMDGVMDMDGTMDGTMAGTTTDGITDTEEVVMYLII